MKSYCDWPENAKCTLEEKRKMVLVNSTGSTTAVRKDNVTITVQKTKANDKIRNVTFNYKDAVLQKGKSENETGVVELGGLNKYQPKYLYRNESKKEVKGGDVKVKTTHDSVKEGEEKSAVKGKTKETKHSGALAISTPSENNSKLEVKSEKGKTGEQASPLEKTPERDSEANKPSFVKKAFHSISKRQDKTEGKQEEIKKKDEKRNEGEKSMTNNKLLTKHFSVKEDGSDMTEVKNVTFKEKELNFANKSLIGFVLNKNNTGDNINNKELSEEPVINNSSDVQYFPVPVHLNSMQDVFGYISLIDAANSTRDSTPDIENPPTSKIYPKIENAPTSEMPPSSEDTSKAGSEPTRKIAPSSTSEPSVGKKRST